MEELHPMSKDRFSKLSEGYALFRPHYPPELYSFILSHTSGRSRVWDCATGTGQAVVELAKHFERVEASDLSSQQLAKAIQLENVTYTSCPAESSPFQDHYFDLITVATAIHWFDFEAFFREVTRVGKPGATLAFWCYDLLSFGDSAIDKLVRHFYATILGPWWDAERQHIDQQYQSIPLPFKEQLVPPFQQEVSWTRDHLAGYLRTWSARKKYEDHFGHDPVVPLMESVKVLWPEDETRMARFPIYLRLSNLPG